MTTLQPAIPLANPHRRRWRNHWCKLAALWTLLCAAAHAAPPPRHVVLLVLDGVGRDLLHDTLRRGELPTMQRLFLREGTSFTDATTNFPSATSPNYPAMIAGLYPGHLGAPYLTWWDRTTRRRYNFLGPTGRDDLSDSLHNWYAEHAGLASPPHNTVRTLFDLLSPLPTAALYVPYAAGATRYAPKIGLAAAWELFVRRRPEALNADAMAALEAAFQAAPDLIPRFAMVGLFATDILGHHHGAAHPRVIAALRTFDTQLAHFVTLLTARGLADQTTLIVTSDHGMHDIHTIVDRPKLLRSHRLRVTTGTPRRTHDLFVAARGIASATLTIRAPGKKWETRPTIAELESYRSANGTVHNLLATLRELPHIDTVLVREPAPADDSASGRECSHVLVHENTSSPAPCPSPAPTAPHCTMLYRGTQRARLCSHPGRAAQRYSYQPLPGDPLGLQRWPAAARLLHSAPAAAATWNHALAATPYPASVPQLAQIFDDGRAGDVILIADADTGFYHRKAATHGSFTARDMRVPLLVHGPGIPHGQVRRTAQLVDLAPTIAAWFGTQFPVTIDGHNLFRSR